MKYEYKRVDTRTRKGIIEAEALQKAGWTICSGGLYLLLFEREIKPDPGKKNKK